MIRIFKNLTRKEVGLMIVSVCFIILQVWLDLKSPEYMSQITVLVETEGSAMADVLKAGGMMLLCALASMACSILVAVMGARIATNFGATLRKRLFHRVQKFSMEEIGRFSTASLITRSTNDVMHVQMLIVMGLQVMIKAPITGVMAIAKIANKGAEWTTATAIAVVILMAIVIVCTSIALPRFKAMQRLIDNINRVTRENLTGLNVIRAYNAEDYQQAKFDEANENLTENQLTANRIMAVQMPFIMLIMNGLTLSIYAIGAVLINKADMMDRLTIFSNMIVFSSYALMVVSAFMMLVIIFIMLPRATVAANRILEVLDTEPTIVDGDVTEANQGIEGEVEFRNVTFRYPDAEDDVLHDISFTAKKGETVAFIGATGCGKSTIINLVPRFYDVTEGEVLVDGVNVKNYTQKALRNKIGYISQRATLFSGSIASNVAYGDNGREEITEEDVVAAMEIAQGIDMIDAKEDGVQSYVAQGGGNFSGGQKQRISIARAIARKPEILIFDDSFSALDYKTDKKLRKQLEKSCRESTKLIVAQRIGTIREADQILVIEDGAVVGSGTHDELMKTCAVYQEIALSQLSKEELA